VAVYVIVTVPAFTPVTTPVAAPTLAMVVLLLVQLPPIVALESVTFKPIHTLEAPDISAGRGKTVTTLVAIHPVDSI
jgi:hypothetical protein